MTAAEELEQRLNEMPPDQLLKFIEPYCVEVPDDFPDYHVSVNPWKVRSIRLLVSSRHTNPPLFSAVCEAMRIKPDSERLVDYQRLQAQANVDAAVSARRANEIAAEANELAKSAKSESAAAKSESGAAKSSAGKADVKSWIALVTAVIGLATAVTKCVTG